jgi:hypothetical protein
VCYAVALVLFLASIAGFVHAARRSSEHEILPRPQSDETTDASDVSPTTP